MRERRYETRGERASATGSFGGGQYAGPFWMAASALLFATMNYFARLSSAHQHWTVVAASRAAIGAMVALSVARGRVSRVFRSPNMWARSLLGTLSMLLTFYALSDTRAPLGDVAAVLNLSPVFMAVLAPKMLGEQVGVRVAGSLALCLAGMLFILRPPAIFGSNAHESAPPFGLWVAAVAALSTALAMIALRRVGRTEPAHAIVAHFSLTAAFLSSSFAVFNLRPLSREDVLNLSCAGLAAGIAQLAMTRAYALERVTRVAGLQYLSVVASALFGASLLGEVVPKATWGGIALICAGGVLVTVSRGRVVRFSAIASGLRGRP